MGAPQLFFDIQFQMSARCSHGSVVLHCSWHALKLRLPSRPAVTSAPPPCAQLIAMHAWPAEVRVKINEAMLHMESGSLDPALLREQVLSMVPSTAGLSLT